MLSTGVRYSFALGREFHRNHKIFSFLYEFSIERNELNSKIYQWIKQTLAAEGKKQAIVWSYHMWTWTYFHFVYPILCQTPFLHQPRYIELNLLNVRVLYFAHFENGVCCLVCVMIWWFFFIFSIWFHSNAWPSIVLLRYVSCFILAWFRMSSKLYMAR